MRFNFYRNSREGEKNLGSNSAQPRTNLLTQTTERGGEEPPERRGSAGTLRYRLKRPRVIARY